MRHQSALGQTHSSQHKGEQYRDLNHLSPNQTHLFHRIRGQYIFFLFHKIFISKEFAFVLTVVVIVIVVVAVVLLLVEVLEIFTYRQC